MVAIKKNEKFLRERCGMNFPPSRFAGSWEMPVLKRVPSSFIPPTRFVDFEKALPLLDYEAGVHFYLDDYRFDDKIWIHPEKFIEKLKPYSCVLTPDFSMFLNMPRAFEPCNVYRSRCLGSLFQSAGITVVPSLQWSDEFSFAYCFDGLPKNSVVSISSVGTMKKKYALKNFRAGLEEALNV